MYYSPENEKISLSDRKRDAEIATIYEQNILLPRETSFAKFRWIKPVKRAYVNNAERAFRRDRALEVYPVENRANAIRYICFDCARSGTTSIKSG